MVACQPLCPVLLPTNRSLRPADRLRPRRITSIKQTTGQAPEKYHITQPTESLHCRWSEIITKSMAIICHITCYTRVSVTRGVEAVSGCPMVGIQPGHTLDIIQTMFVVTVSIDTKSSMQTTWHSLPPLQIHIRENHRNSPRDCPQSDVYAIPE